MISKKSEGNVTDAVVAESVKTLTFSFIAERSWRDTL